MQDVSRVTLVSPFTGALRRKKKKNEKRRKPFGAISMILAVIIEKLIKAARRAKVYIRLARHFAAPRVVLYTLNDEC